MSILKRGNSKYWYIQFQLNGKTYIRSSRTSNKKAAEQMETEWKAKLHAQQFLGQKDRISLRHAIDEFCESKKGTPNYPPLMANARTASRLLPMHKYTDQLTAHANIEWFRIDVENSGDSPLAP